MLDRIAHNGVKTILVECPDRFARDLAIQLAGHDFLKNMGVTLIPATAPDFFRRHADGRAGASGARRDRTVREGVASREAQSGAGPQDSGGLQVRWPQILC
jgi:hypothetical protein